MLANLCSCMFFFLNLLGMKWYPVLWICIFLMANDAQHLFMSYLDSDSMTFCKRQNYGDGNKISGCQELREGRDAAGQWNCCVWYYNAGYMSSYFVKTKRAYNTKNELQCKLGVFGDNDRLVLVHQLWQCMPVVKGVDSGTWGRGCTWVESGDMWYISALSSQIFCEPQITLKIVYCLKSFSVYFQ